MSASTDDYTLVLVPTLGRIERVRRVVANIDECTPEPHAVVLIVEPHEWAATVAALEGRATLDGVYVLSNRRHGHYGAFNSALQHFAGFTRWGWWFHGADDLRFTPGWLSTCLATAAETGADVIGTNDLLRPRTMAGKTATHYLVRRKHRVEVPGAPPGGAYFEGYHHLCGEAEFVDCAREAGLFAPCLDAVVEHMHPMAGKAANDATYEHGQKMRDADSKLRARRNEERRRADR